MRTPDYDEQAGFYDSRAGIGRDIAQQVARAAIGLTGTIAGPDILEIGCGTGEIGQFLSAAANHYAGLDASERMLDKFRQRVFENKRLRLIHTDANQAWPLSGLQADLVFSSRALHLLDPEHVLSGIRRSGSDQGFVCALGRVVRDPDGIADTMRRKMREILRARGVRARDGKRNMQAFATQCVNSGADDLGTIEAAVWQVTESPQTSLNNWVAKPGLAGNSLDQSAQTAVLAELQAWALQHYEAIDYTGKFTSHYVLRAFRFPPH